jgi:hypothetical protein
VCLITPGKSDPYLRVSMVDVHGKVIGQPALTPVVHKSVYDPSLFALRSLPP